MCSMMLVDKESRVVWLQRKSFEEAGWRVSSIPEMRILSHFITGQSGRNTFNP